MTGGTSFLHERKNQVKEISKMFDLPVSTLRYYEDEGILTKVGRTKKVCGTTAE